jgi:predicted enzyme related to lactoylglutathione lyase
MTLDVHDLELTKRFWHAVLGTKITYESEDWVAFAPQRGFSGLDLQRVPEEKVAKNRAHPDIVLSDYETGIKRLVELGAKVAQEVSAHRRRWSVMHDPEGNEFCAIGLTDA